MEYLAAFFVCGCLCAACQAAKDLFKVDDGKVAIGVMVLGALLVPTGAVAFLEAFGQMGVVVTVFDAAGSLCKGMGEVIAGQGPGTIVFVIAIFVAVTLIGLVTGMVYDAIYGKGSGEESSRDGVA